MGFKSGSYLKDVPGLDRALDALSREVRKEGQIAQQEIALDIMEYAVTLTPLESGDLRASVYVDPPTDAGNKLTIEMGYGKYAPEVAEYAEIQHEVTWYYHPVGEDHFLLKAIQRKRPGIVRALAGAINKAMRRACKG